MKRNYKKLGFQSSGEYRVRHFNHINIDGGFAYCKSHKFIFNVEEEKRKLYNAKPCFYTDDRFTEGYDNFYKNCYIYNRRFTPISLKSCIRRVLKTKNIPVGTLIRFDTSWYYSHKKNISPAYIFKQKKKNEIDIKYEINSPGYFDNFSTCEFSKNLTDALRANGFIVEVWDSNPNRLSSLIATAAAYTGKKVEVNNEEGEIAIAYGHGKKIGFSSGNNTLFGYSNGINSILWDKFGEFDKWSRCYQITKTSSIKEILEILMTPNEEKVEIKTM